MSRILMDRRGFCGGLTALGLSTVAGSSKGHDKRPNIVIILADDLGWGDIDAFNRRSAIPTPNLNLLASQGISFDDMHASSAVCTPSRYSLLTGRYCWRSRLKRGVLSGYDPDLIGEGRLTVASMLKAEGYFTAGVGKWHLGLGHDEKTDYSKSFHPCPNDHGFDYYFGMPASLDVPPYVFFENDHLIEQPTESTPGDTRRGAKFNPGAIAPGFRLEQALPTLTKKAVEVIEQRAKARSDPFFLYFAMPAPHNPFLPLDKYKGRSRAGSYGDYVVEVDDMVGVVLNAIEANGFSKDTLVIFTSDNGANWSDEDILTYEHRANGAWRGKKGDIWEGGHRIPFIARWPGRIKPDTRSAEMASLVDITATAAAIVGKKLPDDAAQDSYNMLPALLQVNRVPVRKDLIDHSFQGMFTIREGSWKLEIGLGGGGLDNKTVASLKGGPDGQLYNLAEDPREENNLYQENPEMVKHLKDLLQEYVSSGRSRP